MPAHKSLTGHHRLKTSRMAEHVGAVSATHLSLLTLVFGKGTVVRRIWPAILIHTLFATAVVVVSHETPYHLGIQSILLNVVGMILGFVISYRAISGYDRYWMGRTEWANVMRNSRTLSRLIWYHVPPRLTASKENVTKEDVERVIEEKKVALDLIEGFAFALKHHLRDEPGPYYSDLYHFLVAMETSPYHEHRFAPGSIIASPTSITHNLSHMDGLPQPAVSGQQQYGTFTGNGADANTPLLPSQQPPTRKARLSVYMDLVPFASMFVGVKRFFFGSSGTPPDDPNHPQTVTARTRHPKLAGGGGNIPLEILRCLSEWLAVLEDRATVPGTSLGQMIGTLQAFEDSLTSLEKVMTSPLPLVYAAHIRHTVWLYLFTLPFQITDNFGYLTIPAVAIGAFLYLGFLAAGEEIEQPFGYDKNDLDLDLFCRKIIHEDLEELRKQSTPNTYLAIPGTVDQASIYGRGAIVDAGMRYKVGRETSSMLEGNHGNPAPAASTSQPLVISTDMAEPSHQNAL